MNPFVNNVFAYLSPGTPLNKIFLSGIENMEKPGPIYHTMEQGTLSANQLVNVHDAAMYKYF